MKKHIGFLLILTFVSSPIYAGGLLGDIEKSIGKIADNPAIEKAVRDQAKTIEKAVQDTGRTIERAALVQKVTENALADKISSLEARIAQQDTVIANYERLVTLLRAEIKELSGE